MAHVAVKLVVLLAAVLGGCTHERGEEAIPVGLPHVAATRRETERRFETCPGLLVLSEQLKTECGLPAATPPERGSDFNDSLLRLPGMSMLDAVAECMLSGPLRGRQLSLTAYADERGDGNYNRELGVLRAETVRDYLSWREVPKRDVKLMPKSKAPAEDPERLASRHVELGEVN